jgi:hypothetical protein
VSGQATVSVAPDGTITVTPHAGFAGDVVVSYVVSDGAGGTSTGTLTVHVAPPVPLAVNDHAATPYQTPVVLDVLGNDHSGETGAAASIVAGSVTAPTLMRSASHGSVRASASSAGQVAVVGNKLKYTPPSGFSGAVWFDYTIANPLGGTASAKVTITVKAQPVEQLTEAVTITADKNAVTLDPAGEVTGHGALTLVKWTQPSGGAKVSVVDGHVVVARDAGFVGTVPFTYVVLGADNTLVTVTVTVHVLAVTHTGTGSGSGSGSGSGTSSGGGILPHTGAEVGLVSLAGLLLVGLGTVGIWFAGLLRRRSEDASPTC